MNEGHNRKRTIRVVINGFGRIGRAVFRQMMQSHDILVIHINDTNPSNQNLAYLAKFDSIYGRFEQELEATAAGFEIGDHKISISHESRLEDIDWTCLDFDLLIESTGVVTCQKACGELVRQSIIPRAVCTHSSNDVDKTIILGANESEFIPTKHRYISSSICDANAVAPLLRVINERVGVTGGNVLTLHPWLGYQNLADGPCRSFAYPGQIEENFALGRASTEALIPKTTSCISAVEDVFPWASGISSMSFRVPTPVVSSAIVNLNLESSVCESDILGWLAEEKDNQKFDVFDVVSEPLISKDFEKTKQSCIIDSRWVCVSQHGSAVRVVLWYDNEYAYSARVIDSVRMLGAI
ncbi:hypothetical protein N8005_07270 [Litorivicinus sp.]|nr:hypothetical protein [Litorivicinus sp.]